jgi:hypothetical protein
MTYTCPAWKFAADSHLLKLQRLQNKVLSTTGKLPRPTPTRDLHVVFEIPYVFDFVTELCMQRAEIVQNRENVIFLNISQSEDRHRKYKRLKLGGGQAHDPSKN